ncbi:MAG: S41 family peptidase [Deltaproteobacteria bacterium]|nr:S41 family peptidase [Deltaproteobacteria bacterium]
MSKIKLSIALVLLIISVTLGIRVEISEVSASSGYQEMQLFTDVLTIVRRSYVEEVSIKDLVYGAIDGMLASLDPHSGFMSPEIYKEMKVDTRGEFGGLGIEITMRNGVLTVVAPIEDTPAQRAGLQAGDQILKIEDEYTKDIELMEAVRLMRGVAGTEIKITIMRESFDKPQEFNLTREVIKIQSVKAKTIESGYGYVRLTQFQEKTADDLDQALSDLGEENQGALKGLVLDLRNNPGGLLDQAVEVADKFLDSGLIVYTEGRQEDSQMEFAAKSSGTEPDYPMVVLINGGSASASEIVAGALQDHGRAVVMGTQSFGKGSVQTIIPLSDDSGLRLTTAKYYTPNGTSIQATGIIPDIEVLPGEIKELAEREHFREKDLRNHFDQDTSQKDSSPLKTEPSALDREDYQLMRALDLLKGWQILSGKQAA